MLIRRFSIAGVLLCVAAVSSGAVGAPTAHSKPPKRPNIVVIMTDDQTVESIRVMKNVKRLLVAQGTSFDNSFASFSLCCPSRATFLTGQYAHNHGVLSNKPPYGGYYALDNSNTLPVWLKRAGYETILVGKYLNGYGEHDKHEIPPGWTEWHGAVNNSAYQFYGYTLNENGTLVKYGRDPASYQTDVYADKAVEIVRRRAAERKPFFLWLSFLAPHVGGPPTPGRSALTTLPAPRHLGRFAASPLPTPPSFNEGRRLGQARLDSHAPATQRPAGSRHHRALPATARVAPCGRRCRRPDRRGAQEEGRAVADADRLYVRQRLPARGAPHPDRQGEAVRALDAGAARHARSRRSGGATDTPARGQHRPRAHDRRGSAHTCRPEDGRPLAVAAVRRPGNLLGPRPAARGAGDRGRRDEVHGLAHSSLALRPLPDRRRGALRPARRPRSAHEPARRPGGRTGAPRSSRAPGGLRELCRRRLPSRPRAGAGGGGRRRVPVGDGEDRPGGG